MRKIGENTSSGPGSIHRSVTRAQNMNPTIRLQANPEGMRALIALIAIIVALAASPYTVGRPGLDRRSVDDSYHWSGTICWDP